MNYIIDFVNINRIYKTPTLREHILFMIETLPFLE